MEKEVDEKELKLVMMTQMKSQDEKSCLFCREVLMSMLILPHIIQCIIYFQQFFRFSNMGEALASTKKRRN
jgi:hypothetical protein